MFLFSPNGNAIAIACLISQNPGVIIVANVVFGAKPYIPNDLLGMVFQVDVKVIDQIQSKF